MGDAIPWLRSGAAEVEKETGTQNEFLSLCHNNGSGMTKWLQSFYCLEVPAMMDRTLELWPKINPFSIKLVHWDILFEQQEKYYSP